MLLQASPNTIAGKDMDVDTALYLPTVLQIASFADSYLVVCSFVDLFVTADSKEIMSLAT